MAQTVTTSSTTTTPSPLLRALQVFAGLAVLDVLFQFITAGQLLTSRGPAEAHAAGAIALHVLSGVAAICAFFLWRKNQVGGGLLGLAVAVFVFGFIQAAIGGYDSLYLHVPGAMLLTGGVVWLLVATLRPQRR